MVLRISTGQPNREEIARSGIDILKVIGGLITEVWSVSGGVGGRTFYGKWSTSVSQADGSCTGAAGDDV
ncbi:MAG: hypothetical protein DLM55_05825 [Acidimicrobiales bacterium]|nr:MAG: hypothetical protein DLM55_05825 [Acidimicrobiales bacterium]